MPTRTAQLTSKNFYRCKCNAPNKRCRRVKKAKEKDCKYFAILCRKILFCFRFRFIRFYLGNGFTRFVGGINVLDTVSRAGF